MLFEGATGADEEMHFPTSLCLGLAKKVEVEVWGRLLRRLLQRSCQLGDEHLIFVPPLFFLLPGTRDWISGALASILGPEVAVQSQRRTADSKKVGS